MAAILGCLSLLYSNDFDETYMHDMIICNLFL